ncbi:MAG: M23 family metallopeptidase [Alistipes sp.]|nr:M23 family metallopeptidase [Alistipes sp.]
MPKWARIVLKLFIAMLIAASTNILVSTFWDTPKMSNIRRDNKRLEQRYEILQGKIASAERILADIKHRDHYVYRPLLGVDTLNLPAVYSEYRDSKYAYLLEDEYYGELTASTWRSMDHLLRQIYYASLSLDATQHLAANKTEFSSIIPAIWPIDRTKLKHVSSLYGMRLHPTLGIMRMHEGVDLTAPIGTAVYATGNGTISQSQVRNGYGELIEIDHGFGYKTRYAHLSARFVKAGDEVIRGQIIGEVGNTGVSSGPHLHYEVRYRDNTVNPIHFFNKDMSAESYKELMEQIEASQN